MDCLTAQIAKVTNIVKRMKMRMTEESDGIESDDRERGRKERESETKDAERRVRGGKVMARKTKGDITT